MLAGRRREGAPERYRDALQGEVVRQYASCAWNALLERVDIIPNSMVATMAAAESGWGTSKLARENNNLFGMKCGAGRCRGAMKGYSQFESVEQSVQAYVTNLNTHRPIPLSVNRACSCVKRIRK
jgi:uncharacterized FlgJ-related protein